MSTAKQNQLTKDFIEKFLNYDSQPHELADYIEDNTNKHTYFYRPFVDGDFPDGDKFWKPQVSILLLYIFYINGCKECPYKTKFWRGNFCFQP